MITSFFNSGKGAGSGILYLVEEREPKAEILRGDIDAQIQLIDSLDFKQRYLSGVHRFIETDLPESTKSEIMDSFESVMFEGLSEEAKPPVLWVQHQEKGGTEFHFIIPEVNMETGKKFTPFWHETDLKMVDAWKDTINHEYDLTDPKDPARAQTLTMPKNLPRSHKAVVEKIDEAITGMVNAGTIENRDDVIKTLEDSGFKVVKKSKQFISIKADDWKKPARLKGVFYGERFNGTGKIGETIKRASSEYRERATERYQDVREKLDRELGKRRDRIQKRHVFNASKNREESKQLYSAGEPASLDSTLDNIRDTINDQRGYGDLHKLSTKGVIRNEGEPGEDRRPGGKDKNNFLQREEELKKREALRESASKAPVRRWLQAFVLTTEKLHDRARETLTRWHRKINGSLRETANQLAGTSERLARTSEQLEHFKQSVRKQSGNIDGTIRDNQQSHKTLTLRAEKSRERNQSRGMER